jgi:hypothetical protein
MVQFNLMKDEVMRPLAESDPCSFSSIRESPLFSMNRLIADENHYDCTFECGSGGLVRAIGK